eukprot:253001-Rhodomonas_salina.3
MSSSAPPSCKHVLFLHVKHGKADSFVAQASHDGHFAGEDTDPHLLIVDCDRHLLKMASADGSCIQEMSLSRVADFTRTLPERGCVRATPHALFSSRSKSQAASSASCYAPALPCPY